MTALDVRSFTATPPSLEELFMRHYGDVIDADEAAAAAASTGDGSKGDASTGDGSPSSSRKAGAR